jgi:hypothetical protein
LGDLAAGTLVVYARNADIISGSIPAGKEELLDSYPPLRRIEAYERQALLSAARRFAIIGKARTRELCADWVKTLCGSTLDEPEEYLLALAARIGGNTKK